MLLWACPALPRPSVSSLVTSNRCVQREGWNRGECRVGARATGANRGEGMEEDAGWEWKRTQGGNQGIYGVGWMAIQGTR